MLEPPVLEHELVLVAFAAAAVAELAAVADCVVADVVVEPGLVVVEPVVAPLDWRVAAAIAVAAAVDSAVAASEPVVEGYVASLVPRVPGIVLLKDPVVLAEVGSDWPDLQQHAPWPSAAALVLAAVAVAAAAAAVVEHAVAELAELAGPPAAELLVAADVLLAVAVFFEPVLVQLVVPVVPVAPVENVVDEQVKGHPGLHRWLAALLQIVGGSWLDLAYRHFASVVLDDALA